MNLRNLLVGVLLVTSGPVWAAEEDLNLDNLDKMTERASPVVIPKTPESKFTFMGRLDLTAEVNPVKEKSTDNESDLRNWHGLRLFLKLKASPKTTFFGEVANQDFYYVDYRLNETQTVSFGRILVPFGDTRFFHHFYGGIQGKGATGVMFPNVWTESGANLQSQLGEDLSLDTYLVNGFKSITKDDMPDFTNSADGSKRQALGARLQWQGLDHVTLLGSAYFDNYWENRQLLLLGFDAYTDYGLVNLPIRAGIGIANASADKIPNEGKLQRRGDYLLLAGRGLGPGELRFRYGTYNHIVNKVTDDDSHSFDLAYLWHVDVIRVMLQRQWNFEAQNEKEDDLWRLMASLDF